MKHENVNKRIKVEFGGLEILDAKVPLRLQPMPCDVIGATPKDPTNCVFARTSRRMYGSIKVLFWQFWAYVDLVGEDGVRRVYRYRITQAMHRLLAAFDRGEPIEQGRAFVLLPPSKGSTLLAQRRRSKQDGRTKRGKLARRVVQVRRNLKSAAIEVKTAIERLNEAKASKCKADVQAAAMRRREAQARLIEHTKVATEIENQIKVRKYTLTSPKKATSFDMTVRNGLHKYTFVGIDAA